MSGVRDYLIATLQHIVDGGDVTTEELDAAIPDPRGLERAEKVAWEQLSHWADDADIRAKDSRYAAFKREWMREQIKALSP